MLYIVGAGGVGGYLTPVLSKLNKHVTIIDGDKIEEKNLLRQNFQSDGIGIHKAEYLAKKYGGNFHNKFINEKSGGLFEKGSVVFMCVDSHKCRHDMFQIAKDRNLFIVNGANELDEGQAFIYHNRLEKTSLKYYGPVIERLAAEPEKPSVEELCITQRPETNYIVAGLMMWLYFHWKHDIKDIVSPLNEGKTLQYDKMMEVSMNKFFINIIKQNDNRR